jgi:radical SAM enzyme (TIGR01210 family)
MRFVDSYSSLVPRYSFSTQEQKLRWLLMLPGSGCAYRKASGGCTMCGFGQATDKYTKGYLYPSIVFRSLFRWAERHVGAKSPTELAVFNGGSFWNDKEIPVSFQDYLYRRVAKNKTLEMLFIENRCDFISPQKISQAQFGLNGKKLMVGLGLESQDDFVRNNLIRKGLSKTMFEQKVRLLKDSGAQVLAYVFLKPLGLSEKEAYHEALKTIVYALEVGVDEIDLSCAFVQENTTLALAYKKGEFTPPWLWTIIEIIKQIIDNNWPVSIGGFSDEPPPVAIPTNCPECSQEIYEIIDKFRKTRKLSEISDCSCRQIWADVFK